MESTSASIGRQRPLSAFCERTLPKSGARLPGHFVALTLILVFLFIAYRDFVYDVPRSDSLDFARNLIIGNSDLEYLWRTLSYGRTRQIGVGDSFLFRPGLTGYLGLREVFLYDYPVLRGVLSISLAAMSYWSVYLLLRKFVAWSLAISLVMVLMTNVPGLELITYSHVTPYLLAVAFTALAFLNYLSLRPRMLVIAGLLCVAMSFHDALAWALIPAALALYLVGRTKRLNFSDPLVRAALISSVVYLALNAVDYVAHQGFVNPSGPADRLLGLEDVVRLPLDYVALLGASAGSVISGWALEIGIDETTGATSWQYNSATSIWILGLAVMLLMLILYLRLQPEVLGNQNLAMWSVGFVCLLLPILMTGLLTIGRTGFRGEEYLQSSTWNFGLLAAFWVICFTVLLRLSGIGRRPQIALSCLFALIATVQLWNHQAVVDARTVFLSASSRLEGQSEYVAIVNEALQQRLFNGAVVQASSAEISERGLLVGLQPGWHAAQPVIYPQTITIQLTSLVTSDRILLVPQDGFPERMPGSVSVQVSDDGVSWADARDPYQVCQGGNPVEQGAVPLPALTTARWWRLVIHTPCGDSGLLTLKRIGFN